jgi:putative oxygen-independent coproporphyrinogen III oxidase
MPSLTAPARSHSSPTPAWRARAEDDAFGVYVHWPFCASKCPYCDFNSHVRAGGIDEARFVRAFRREIEHWARLAPGRTVSSIFFGGGTPSLMSAEAVGAILDAIAGSWAIAPDVEVTLEANPSSVEAGRFRGYRAAGVNRVSLGVQALDDDALRALGRLHSAAEACAAIEVARSTFDRFSFDLIYARAGQTVEAWRSELARAFAIAGRHLSLYQLTIEQGTPFAELHARGKLRTPDSETGRSFYQVTQEMTDRAGLPAYEISNHAAPGEESRHNLLYWRYGEYVGLGPGAHGRVVLAGARHAIVAERKPEAWVSLVENNGSGSVESVALTDAEQADEALLMGLRLREGLDLDRLSALTGHALARQTISDLVALGLIESEPGRIRAKPEGLVVLDEIVRRLASALEPAGR